MASLGSPGLKPRVIRIHKASLFAYSVALRRPVRLNRELEMSRREGLLLKLEDENEVEGWGEAAPLPGYSRETLAEVIEVADRLLPALPGIYVPNLEARLVDDLAFQIAELSETEHPSLRFAVSAAATSLAANREGVALPQLYRRSSRTRTFNAALLQGSEEEIIETARAAAEDGYLCAKMKVGRGDVDRDADLVHEVRRILGDGVSIRLDANRAWTPSQALDFANAIEGTPIEFIEEPLQDPAELSWFAKETRIPVALDETLLRMPDAAAGRTRFAAAYVLKPTFLGLNRTVKLARLAATQGINVVFSSAYETGVAMSAIAALAMTYGTASLGSGLGTHQLLQEDVLEAEIDFSDVEVSASDLVPNRLRVDYARLLKIKSD